ncbi:MAG TPA: TonB family protein [Thermoanaerobaculia bacterium]|nr:TonB family protein [Thermoanaerobaculia bacterium]
MNIPEEFGKYLLLKKLTEDPLGETFRAGRVGKAGMEQVVLLRVFNGKGMDGEKLWERVANRAAVQQALRSPNIGSGVDLGKVRSFPYVAYDYISGKNLATLFAQAERQMSPIPTDHALLVTERISLALAAAHETRVQDERVLHGFVVPHLIMISNEGEARLLGFEIAPGLRALAAAGWVDPVLRPYLAPEALEGAPVGKADDVWSLGAILYELLTGERLPAPTPEGYGALFDAAVLPNEGTPLPPAIVGLLKKSLAPRDQRIADPVTWHKTLSKLMIDGQYSPTTFNLAFFMHNLFRDEIERESKEVEAEKRLELPQKPAAPVPVPVAAPVADVREATGVRQGAPASAKAAPGSSSKAGLFVGLAAAVLLAAVGGGAWYFFSQSNAQKEAAAAAAAAVQPAPMTQPASMSGPAPAPVPAGPTREELEAQIRAMLDTQSQQMEAKLKSQYDDRVKQLQQQLDETKRREEQARQAPAPAPAPAVQEPEPEPIKQADTAPVPSNSAPTQTVTAPSASTTPEKTEPAPAQTRPQTTAPAPAPAQTAPRQPQYGELVQAGPGITTPRLKGRLDPRYPSAAQRLNKAAVVDIRVLVDEKGSVLDAQRSGPKAGFGFDEAAIEAARRATFTPAATRDGVRVKMWTVLRVSFQPGR